MRPGATVLNVESNGNLSASNALKCTTLDKVSPDYTPADMYPAFADCVDKGRYQDATQLFMLAGADSSFDVLRVSDITAHDAKTVLVMKSMATIDPTKKAAWAESMKTYLAGAGHTEGCATIRRLGPPSYYPSYMIQHGMAALTGGNQAPLVTPFDASAAWQSVLTTYLQYPV